MNRILTLVLLCVVLAFNAYSQNCTPIPNPTAGPDCASAPFLCCGEVNGLSGTTSTIPNPSGPNPLCPGTQSVPNNTEWVSFAAGSTSITISLDLQNCTQTGQGAGAQVGIYSDCNFSSTPYCNGNQNQGTTIIALNNLTIGEVYHLFIDGWNGSSCDYTFTVTSGSTVSPEPQSPIAVTSQNNITSLCEGAGPQTFNAPLGANSSFNLWEVTPALPFIDNGTSMTITDWSAAAGGTVQICATGLNDCYQDPTPFIPTCYNVTVNQNLQMSAMGSYCQEQGGYDFPDDNLPTLYQFGTHQFSVPNPTAGLGCEIEWTLTVTALQPEQLDSMIVLCPGEAWCNPNTGQCYTPPAFGPINLMLPYGVGSNFCQRNINLQLSQVDTMAQIIASPTTVLNCDNPNIILTAGTNFDPQVTYSYEWDTPDGNIVGATNLLTCIVNQEGTYTLQVTMETSDDRGPVICDATFTSIVITEDVVGPDVSVTAQTPSSCGIDLNGTATVTPSGGVAPYTFVWDAAAGGQITATATGLAPGTYSVTVLDNTQCESITAVTVEGTPVVALNQVPTINNVGCFGETTGSATVSATGGTGTIMYTWDVAAGGQSGPTASGLGVGTYWVTAVDDLGCEDILSVDITGPTGPVVASVDVITPSACGLSTGSITLNLPTGGSGGYTYVWSDVAGSTSQDLTNAGAGSYEVTVYDANNCPLVLSGSIPNADGPSIDALVVTDAGCSGAASGELDLQITGGAMPFTIDWAGAVAIAQNEMNPTNLPAGPYNVTITDANMCDVTGTATVGEPAILTASATATASNCGQSTGDITLTVNGGSTVSSYIWDGGAPAVQNPQDQGAGTYNVTVTDIFNCEAYATVVIDEPDAPVGTSQFSNVSCNGLDDGSVSVNITTGGGGYTYAWDVGGLTPTASNSGLAPGAYTVTVTDANNCTVEFTETVDQPTAITATLTPAATECFGEANGSATATALGGSGSGYQFQWCNLEISDTPTSLPAGVCSVTVTDGAGCEEILSVNVPEAPQLVIGLDAVTNLDCFEDNSGAIAIDAAGGTGSLSYSWSGPTGIPNTTEDPTGLEAGTYTVTVIDDNGCDEEILNIDIIQPDDVEITFTADDASCNLPNGSIDVTVTGGTGTPDYTWSPDLGTGGVFTDAVASGTYNLTVTDVNGCQEFETIVVDEPNAMALENEIDGAVACFGDATATVSVEASGGTGPGTYEYVWADGFPDAPSVDNLPVGTYLVDIIDGNGCILPAEVEVTEPTELTVVLDNAVDPSCQTPDGSINITPAGGTVTTGYTFDWNVGQFSTEDISGLGQGMYDVIVTDNNGCEQTASYSITAPGSFTIDQVVDTDVTCFGLDNGTISVTTAAGTGPFVYTWSDSAIGDDANPTGLAPGFYTPTITDQATGCIQNGSPIEITEPAAITFSNSVVVDASCDDDDGSIDVTIAGGTGTPSYSWTGPPGFPGAVTEDLVDVPSGSYTLEITDVNNCMGSLAIDVDIPTAPTLTTVPTMAECNGTATGSIQAIPNNPNGAVIYTWDPSVPVGATDVATGLPIGSYSVTITDAENCTAESLSIIIDEPSAIDVQFTTMDAACGENNGQINLTVTGGTSASGNYTYTWDSALPSTEDQPAVAQGDYNVTVTDDNGCQAFELISVMQPNAASIIPTVSGATCFEGSDGAITLNVSGGNDTNGYTFQWDGTSQVVQNPTGLAAGFYSVTVFDSDNCETTFPNIEVTQATQITVDPVATPALCNQNIGTITLTPSGGTGTYTYDWADPNVADVFNPTGLAPGNYEVTVMDQVGCTFTEFYAVENPDGVEFDQSQVDNLCFGDTEGSATIDIQNVDPNTLTIEWLSGPIAVPNGTLNATNLVAGMYSGNITDNNNCVTPFSFNITQPADAVVGSAVTNSESTCFGDNNGIAIAQAVGGTGTYTYAWDNGDMTDQITGLAPGSYEVTITDQNGCSDTPAAIIIIEPDLLEVDEDFTDLTCNGDDNGTINLVPNGGNGGYQYDWNQNQYDGLDALTGLTAGTYEVVVSDVENCSETLSITIEEPAAIDLQVATVSEYETFNVSCNEATDGFISVNVNGGSGNYEYAWSNGATTAELNDIPAGSYTVTVTDQNLCNTEITEVLTEPTAIDVISEEIDVRCAGETNGAIVVTSTQGGAGPYVYSLDDSPFDVGVFNGLPSGTYELITQDANGCETMSELNIQEPNPLEVVLGEDMELEFGDSVTLTPIIALGGAPLQILEWDNEEVLCPLGNCLSINAKPLTTTTYQVTVVDENGCVHEDQITLRVKKTRNVYIPNVFNPDSNNPLNQVFQMETGRGVTAIEEFIVVDRWGEVVYRIPNAFDPNIGATLWGWDGNLRGKPMNPAVFVYYAKVRFLDGEILEYGGDVTLLR